MEKIKKILDSEVGLLVEDTSNETENNKKIIIDNRFELLKNSVDLVENKDENFYAELIRLISGYLDKLCDSKLDDFSVIVFDESGELISQDYDCLDNCDINKLESANHELSTNLFDYICQILEENKDIRLDINTLKRLLNRNPKLFTLSVEESYLYRTFDFAKLANILSENEILKKSNISIDDTYELLIDTCQIDNDKVFGELIKPEEFKQNHQVIDELLNECNAKAFVDITNIIIRDFDKDFDRLSFAKRRKSNNFCERVIISLLKSYTRKEDYSLIHELLTDESIGIDYDYYCSDYFGQTSLKELIALSGNKLIVKDLLSKEENIQNSYWHGESFVHLYQLYAITGEYEKALETFQNNYNYAYDFTEDFTKGFNEEGYAYGGWQYEDSLATFVKNICKSLKDDDMEYSEKKELINRILDNEKVEYINLGETLPHVKKVLSDDDFGILVDTLTEKYNAGNLKFIFAEEHFKGFFTRYIIKIASDEQVQDVLSDFNPKGKSKVLSLNNTHKKGD